MTLAAKFSETEIRRIIRAARKEGVRAVRVLVDRREIVIAMDDESPLSTLTEASGEPANRLKTAEEALAEIEGWQS